MTIARTILSEIINTLNGKSIDDLDARGKSVFDILESHKVMFKSDNIVASHEHTPGIKVRCVSTYEIVQDGFKTKEQAEEWISNQFSNIEPGSDFYNRSFEDYEVIGKEIKPTAVLYEYKIEHAPYIGGWADQNKQQMSSKELFKNPFRSISNIDGELRFTGYSLGQFPDGSKYTILNNPTLVTTKELAHEEVCQIASDILVTCYLGCGYEAVQ